MLLSLVVGSWADSGVSYHSWVEHLIGKNQLHLNRHMLCGKISELDATSEFRNWFVISYAPYRLQCIMKDIA